MTAVHVMALVHVLSRMQVLHVVGFLLHTCASWPILDEHFVEDHPPVYIKMLGCFGPGNDEQRLQILCATNKVRHHCLALDNKNLSAVGGGFDGFQLRQSQLPCIAGSAKLSPCVILH
jgi:hypothetical protein